MFELRRYQLTDERVPVAGWLSGLRGSRVRVQIEIRRRRVSNPNAGVDKPAGEGVSESRIDVGSGYRV